MWNLELFVDVFLFSMTELGSSVRSFSAYDKMKQILFKLSYLQEKNTSTLLFKELVSNFYNLFYNL